MKIIKILKKRRFLIKASITNFSKTFPKKINLQKISKISKKNLQSEIIKSPLEFSTTKFSPSEFFSKNSLKINLKETILHLIYYTTMLEKNPNWKISKYEKVENLKKILYHDFKNFNFVKFKENIFLLQIFEISVNFNQNLENENSRDNVIYIKKIFQRILYDIFFFFGNFFEKNKKIIFLKNSEKILEEIIIVIEKNIKMREAQNLKVEDFFLEFLDMIFEEKKKYFDINLMKKLIIASNGIILKNNFYENFYCKIFNFYFDEIKMLKQKNKNMTLFSYFRGMMIWENEKINLKKFFFFLENENENTKNLITILDTYEVFLLFKQNEKKISKKFFSVLIKKKNVYPLKNKFHIQSLKKFIILNPEISKKKIFVSKIEILLKDEKFLENEKKKNKISELQKKVFLNLKRMKINKIEIEKEFFFGRVDLFINDEIVIEVLGNLHFWKNYNEIDLNSQMKFFLAKKIGLRFFFVKENFYKNSDNKIRYLQDLINNC